MQLSEVDGVTFCPDVNGGHVRHLPRTEDAAPRTVAYVTSHSPWRERPVIVTECRQLADPPPEARGDSVSFESFETCPECVTARAGITIPAGHTLAGLVDTELCAAGHS